MNYVEKYVMNKTKNLRKRIFLFRNFFAFYFIYILFSGVLYFAFPHRQVEPEELFPLPLVHDVDQRDDLDRVVLVDDGEESIAARIGLIHQAQTSIEIAYHSLHSGIIADVFYASLLEAADRGVQVRILMDGVFHRLHGKMRDLRYVLESNTNIEFRLYEPLNIYKPWTWNNRLHDKIMVVDGEIALISGRNIGNRYHFSDPDTRNFVFDNDVFVLSVDGTHAQSAVSQIGAYFDLLWDHSFTKKMKVRLTVRHQKKALERKTSLIKTLRDTEEDYPQYFIDAPTWLAERSLPVSWVQLIHNPIARGKKEPWVWASLAQLAHGAEQSIVVQSPYIIPTKGMLKYLEVESLAGKEVLLLTNSLASSPNLLGVAGYKGKREFLGSWVTEIWEYYGPGSLHGKAMLFDHNLSAVGSFNMDSRSSFLSTETMLIVKGEDFNRHLREVMEGKAKHGQPILASQQAPPAPWYKRLVVGIVGSIARFFDYLL